MLKSAHSIKLELANEDELRGAQALGEACLAPIKQILKNAGISSDLVVSTLPTDLRKILMLVLMFERKVLKI